MGIYEDIQKGQLEEQTFIKKSLASTIGEMLDRVKDEISKAKKAEIGTVSTHGGVKVRKEANGWVPVKEERGEKSGEGEEVKKPSTPEELGEHAKKASEQALTNATKMSTDPVVREAAHKELMRRKNEEAQETFKDPNGASPVERSNNGEDIDENGEPLSEEAKNGKKLLAEEKAKKDKKPSMSDEDAKDIDWITRLVKGGHLDMAKKEVQSLDTNVREMLPKAIYDKAMGIEKEKKPSKESPDEHFKDMGQAQKNKETKAVSDEVKRRLSEGEEPHRDTKEAADKIRSETKSIKYPDKVTPGSVKEWSGDIEDEKIDKVAKVLHGMGVTEKMRISSSNRVSTDRFHNAVNSLVEDLSRRVSDARPEGVNKSEVKDILWGMIMSHNS